MLTLQIIAFTLSLAPWTVSAGMFPKDSLVKILDAKTFHNALLANQTSLMAFVAPWCGHCQKMVPEYSKAALGLYPLIPAYAVNCHAEKNKRLCSEQGVQGFPTVKLFPRGNTLPPVLYEDDRSASGFWYFATRGIPKYYNHIFYIDDVEPWIGKDMNKHRVILLTKEKKVPLLWEVLCNKYSGTDLEFASHRERQGKTSIQLGFEAGTKKESKVLVYPIGSKSPIRFQGNLKYDSLTKFFDSILDGTADLPQVIEELKQEEYTLTDEELDIQKKQEAQKIALMHGGYTDLIDFEKAILQHGDNYHDSHGYGGMMGGGMPKPKKAAESESEKVSETLSVSVGSAPVTDDMPRTTSQESTKPSAPTGYTATAEQVVLKPDVSKDQCSGNGESGNCASPSKDEL